MKVRYRKSKRSKLKDQVRRLVPKLCYISDADEPVQLAPYPLVVSKVCARMAQGDPVIVQSGEEFFEPLLLDPYWSRLWRILQKLESGIQVLRVGGSEQAIFIISDSLVLETSSLIVS
ncbi:MAG: hypothetical protein NW237_09255 [Cyanobacteriota bacterium]|nr:hypothetical protein [Cyanobacteriota bacterium]